MRRQGPAVLTLRAAVRRAWRMTESEAHRQNTLWERPDAHQRMTAAQAKRERKAARRRYEADCVSFGLALSKWGMGSHD